MAKASLREPFATLESDLIETMRAGLQEYRRDLDFPESNSDMAGCIRAVLRKYDVKLRPVPLDRNEINEPEPMCPVCLKSVDGGVLTPIKVPGKREVLAHQSCVIREKT